ncbi:MAG: hypothetical protein ACKVX9_19580 [Blastocatellia bacterium]
MKGHQHRQRVQNGMVVRRAAARAGEGARATRGARSGRRREAAPERGSHVLWIMIVVGGLLTIGFVLGVRSQITAHQINQAEERLRTELDRVAAQQKFLAIEQDRAISPAESTRAGREAGLVQMKFNEPGGRINALPGRAATRPSAPQPESEDDAGGSRLLAARSPGARSAPAAARARVSPAVYSYAGRGAATRSHLPGISREKAGAASARKTQARPTPGAARGTDARRSSKPAAAKREPVNQRQVARLASRR